MKVLKSHKCFDGLVRFWQHDSKITGTSMKFSTFTPQLEEGAELRGALIWLSGLTCTDENFMAKAGAQKYLAEQGLMVICPDTSPRGLDLPEEHEAYDFGSGAGFYVNATTAGYKDHYRMYDYISEEIVGILQTKFKVADRISIFGHSMGGHGALVLGLREKGKFKSISAFAPICNPMKVEWGKKAFSGYLGGDVEAWRQYDATGLIEAGHSHPQEILLDQGSADEFLEKQLLPENFESACRESGLQELISRHQGGYDHSYYFISTFIKDHIEFHAKHMK